MQQEGSQLQTRAALDYAPPALRRRHSFYSILSLALAALTVGWLWYVEFVRPKYHQGGPLWEVLWDWSWLPGTLGFLLAIIGLHQESRKRWLSVVAMVVIVLAYLLLPPPKNFA
jgi:hypothetical protein